MTVEELIQELECMDRDAEVRLAEQPAWPFEYNLSGVVESGGKVWLTEGDQLGYLGEDVRGEIGW